MKEKKFKQKEMENKKGVNFDFSLTKQGNPSFIDHEHLKTRFYDLGFLRLGSKATHRGPKPFEYVCGGRG